MTPHQLLRDGHIEAVPLAEIARLYGTPTYVYSRAALLANYSAWRAALASHPDALICYAVKANGNLALLDLFARAGAGFDIVSGGELARVLAAGGDPAKVVFSGVGKREEEMEAALAAGILCFNVESADELFTLSALAKKLGRRAPVSLRVNPDIDAGTHPYIATGLASAKFGVPVAEALELYRWASQEPSLRIVGIDCHIGSQLLDPAPAAEAAKRLLALADRLTAEGIPIEHLDLGGGLGICYRDEAAPTVADYLAPILAAVSARKLRLIFEPGRSLVGNAGLLLTRVLRLKHGPVKHFAIVDAAMNDLARPALYDAWHEIVKVVSSEAPSEAHRYEIVGPVCETGDFLGHDRLLALAKGDLLAILSAGAYGMSMSSNYNARPRAAEVLVDGHTHRLIRRRETFADLIAAETGLS
ncbi:MAG: diaminopimelate decarboxylase [Rhodocyclaceae bacterium]|nr:diaminopimelate decarboxylase [Rhodocyclaceae bacterium]